MTTDQGIFLELFGSTFTTHKLIDQSHQYLL